MQDGMRLKISKGNRKIGNVPNISLPPVTTCQPKVPCINNCYALKTYNRWPEPRNAWSSNLELYNEDPERFFDELCVYLALNRPYRFRFFVGGDFPDVEFAKRIFDIASTYDAINFLAFTKRYDYMKELLRVIPDNFKVVLSIWPGLSVPDLINYLPSAWLSEDPRFSVFFKDSPYIRCPGKCDNCGYKCWAALNPELPVVFNLH